MVVPTRRHHGHHRRVSSTVSADCYNGSLNDNDKLLLQQHGHVHQPKKKSVRIDESHNTILELEANPAWQGASEQWYSSQELDHLKWQSQQEAKQMAKTTATTQNEDVAMTRLSSASYRTAVKTLHHACHLVHNQQHQPHCHHQPQHSHYPQQHHPHYHHQPPPAYPHQPQAYPALSRSQLNALHDASAHHGLERWLKRLRHAKHDKLQQLHACLQQYQGSFFAQEEWMRWHCEHISLPSRLFAFFMAAACAESVQRFHHEEDENDHKTKY